MASRNFSNLSLLLATGSVDFSTATFKAVIVSAVPDETALDTWVDRADVTSEIAATGGYASGGFDVTASVGTVDATNDRTAITFSAAAPTYSGATISGVGCIIYKSTGVAANDVLIGFVDWLGTVSSTAGDFTASFTTPMYIDVTPA